MSQVLILNPSGKKFNITTKGEKTMAKKRGYHLRTIGQIGKGQRIMGHIYRGNPGFGYRPSFMSRFNPGAALAGNIVHPINMDGLKTLGAVTLGFAGTALIPTRKLIEMLPVIGKLPVLPILIANGINMTLLASGAKFITKNSDVANNVLAGGLAATGVQIIGSLAKAMPNVAVLQKVTSAVTMAGLGADDTTKVKKMIEERIRKELNTTDGLPAESSYSTANGLPAESSYSTVGNGDELTEDTM